MHGSKFAEKELQSFGLGDEGWRGNYNDVHSLENIIQQKCMQFNASSNLRLSFHIQSN